MGLWNLFTRRARDTRIPDPVERDRTGTIRLRQDPYVFECRVCGKVFEVRRLHPLCPECDSPDVELMA